MNSVDAPPQEWEFSLEDRHFRYFQTLARDAAGIELNESKRELVYGRLARRLRALGLTSFDDYLGLVDAEGAPERINFINAITTNVTSFFRENHHFDFLAEEALPQLMRSRASTRRLRIWSAACSTGQEPYSIAITMARSMPVDQGWDYRILATDIDGGAVADAQVGIYDARELAGLPEAGDQRRWFRPVAGNQGTRYQVEEAVQRSIYFRVLNLMEPWPMQGPIDVIFCRNVVIYFSKETQRKLFSRFAEILAPDGYLFIGHSESMLHAADLFELVGRTTYRPKGLG
ncbi:MAG: protein-glutamate O-methyltransferase [Actinomycetota bacterium]|nr:protein-glutamate O-methyltransferase [Actinomycetota bacterium]